MKPNNSKSKSIQNVDSEENDEENEDFEEEEEESEDEPDDWGEISLNSFGPPGPHPPPHHGPPPPFYGPHPPPHHGPPPPFYGPHPPHHGPHPPPHHGPHPPHFGEPPLFGGPGPGFPMRKEEINDLRYFFILNLLTEFSDGITVYQLQEKYKMPRGNVNRILDELQGKEYVSINETVKDGRAQKLYSLTDKGQELLVKLKKKWAGFFSQMSDHAPPEEFDNPFLQEDVRIHFLDDLSECQSKEEAIDMVHGIRAEITRQRNHVEKRLKTINNMKDQLDKLIEFLEKQTDFDLEEVRKFMESNKDESQQ